MLSLVYGLMSKYQVDSTYIDGANPSFIRSLKLQIGEEADYDKVIARYRSDGFGDEYAYQDTHLVKLELLSNATTIDSALNYIRSKQQQQSQQKELALDSTDKKHDYQPEISGKQTIF